MSSVPWAAVIRGVARGCANCTSGHRPQCLAETIRLWQLAVGGAHWLFDKGEGCTVAADDNREPGIGDDFIDCVRIFKHRRVQIDRAGRSWLCPHCVDPVW